jgi:hypothetical protein
VRDLALGLILLAGALAYHRYSSTPHVNSSPTEFQDTDGRGHSLPDPSRAAVVVFWVEACPYCERAMRVLSLVRASHPRTRVDVLGLYVNSADDTRVRALAEDEGFTVTQAAIQKPGQSEITRNLISAFNVRAPGRHIYVVAPGGPVVPVDASDLDKPDATLLAEVKAAVERSLPPS